MIVDVHTHPFKSWAVFPRAYFERFYQFKKAQIGEEAAERLRRIDGSVEALIRDMDEAGVEKSVISPLDYSVAFQEEPEISIWRANEYAAEAQENNPDRIIAFAGVDPQRKDAIELLETAITKWGLKGVKILPTCLVTDEVVQSFMRKVDDLEIPVLIHQGVSVPPFAVKYGNPADLDLLAHKYPRMKVIAAHVAEGHESLLLAVIKYRAKTIYTDIASMQYDTWQSPWYFTMLMRLLMDKIPD
ncbi:amidohydrolase family protein, partial [Chloroflexota bacterium]